jgi:hypothetical protein
MFKAKAKRNPQPVSNATMAYHFISDAQVYLDAARTLDDFRFKSPLYFLLCHAMELSLKSFILAFGGTQSEMKFELGHRLKRTFERAVALGYAPNDERVGDLVDWLSPYHETLLFRYEETGIQILPLYGEAVEIIQGMLSQIEPLARKDRTREI